jgi:hypothetical protein
MVRTGVLALLWAFELVALAAGQAPEPAGKLDRVIGEVTAIEAGSKRITVKTDSGSAVEAALDEKTLFLRIPPGEKDLKKAARIALEEIAVGDRVYVRGRSSADQKSIAAVAVVIMTKAELAQKHERDREEWKKRGMAGPVTAINSGAKEFTITVRTREGPKPMIIEAGENASHRRYAPDSVRFSDAKPGSFADVKVGDQVRVLGEKSADGGRLKAEEIVSGSFRNVAGAIKSIDAASGDIKLTDLVSHKPVTIHVSADTAMRRLPPTVAAMLARREGGPAGAAGPHAGPGRAEGGAAAGSPPSAEQRAEWQGGGGMRRGGGVDFQDMLERMPPLTLAELKPGDAIMLSATNGTDPASVTAINLLAGVEPLLTAAPEGGQQIFGTWNFDMGMPQ